MSEIKVYTRNEEEESLLGQKEAAKFDQGKNRYDLLSMEALKQLAKNYASFQIAEKNNEIPILYNRALFHARSFWRGEDYYLKTTQHNMTLAARYFFELIVKEQEIKEVSILIENSGYIDDERHDLIPPTVLDELVKVYTYGTIKYDDNNWRKGVKWGRLYGALERHASKWRRNEIYDDESGIHHIVHAIWQCFSLLEYYLYGIGVDDRFRHLDD